MNRCFLFLILGLWSPACFQLNEAQSMESVVQKSRTQHMNRQLLRSNLAAWSSFLDFVRKYKKTYSTNPKEMKRRYKIFRNNLKLIKTIQKYEQGSAQYGVTKFADMTPKEFGQTILMKKRRHIDEPRNVADVDVNSIGKIPENFDWREHNAVTAVKSQGDECGSCWAFSTTGNIEGQWAIQKKSLVSLSEEELIDCDNLDDGCDGGLPIKAYKEIMRLGGLEREKDYKYQGKRDKCKLQKKKIVAYINDSISLPTDESVMASWLFKNGPISVALNAFSMQYYKGGIAHPWKIFCWPSHRNHAVLIVGYGVKGDEPYWTIKNSWGMWGPDDGYYYLYRGKGLCGVDQEPTSAIVK